MKEIKLVRMSFGVCEYGHLVGPLKGKLPEKCNCGAKIQNEVFQPPVPERKHQNDAGFDLVSTIDCVVTSDAVCKIPLGIKIQLPEEDDYIWEAQIRPRSGLAAEGLTIINSPGTIDSSYRGELAALCIMQLPGAEMRICRGDRVCQLVITRIPKVRFIEVEKLDETERGAGGFGSTGL